MLGGNQTQLKLQNRRQVLRELYRLERTTRVALATGTGLTKPTISSLVAELIEEGLVTEDGLGRSTGQGGKRPTLLRFRPDARQVIGVAVERGKAVGVLADLIGAVTARHAPELAPADAVASIKAVAAALLPQLDAPLLGIAFAIPGQIDTAAGVIRRSVSLGLQDAAVEVGTQVPVWLANYAELSALGQLAFGFEPAERPASLVTVALDGQVELGVSLRFGADHFGSELAAPLLAGIGLDAAGLDELLPAADPDSCLLLRYRAGRGEAAATAVLQELAERLARLCAWAVLIVRPERLSLGGRLADLGEEFLELLRMRMIHELGEVPLPIVGTAHSEQLAALGAAALVLQKELGLLS